MVKLTCNSLKFLTKNDFRVLTAIEMGMKNHDLVPLVLINSLANLKFGGTFKSIEVLHKHKLIYHQSRPYHGYRLTFTGYDYLALKTFVNRLTVSSIGNVLGVGKESNIYFVANDQQETMALKLARLGCSSFRSVKLNRDYLQHRKSASWLYFSRLAAFKEYCYMKVLHDHQFPVPRPIDYNRHAVVMEYIPGVTLENVKELRHPDRVYLTCMKLIVKLAEHGLIHGDFNEFNLLITDDEEVTMIDFPQMVSTDHPNAQEYFDRDVECIQVFFRRRFKYESSYRPEFQHDIHRTGQNLDKEVHASGFTKSLQKKLEQLAAEEEKIEGSLEKPEGEVPESDELSDSESWEERDEDPDFDEEEGLLALDKNDNKARIRGNPHQANNTNDAAPERAIAFEDEEADIEIIKEIEAKLNLNETLTAALDHGTDPLDNGDGSSQGSEEDVSCEEPKEGEPEGEKKDERANEKSANKTNAKKPKSKKVLTEQEAKAEEIRRRKEIQKKVKGNVRNQDRRKAATKNQMKSREKRALKNEVNDSF